MFDDDDNNDSLVTFGTSIRDTTMSPLRRWLDALSMLTRWAPKHSHIYILSNSFNVSIQLLPWINWRHKISISELASRQRNGTEGIKTGFVGFDCANSESWTAIHDSCCLYVDAYDNIPCSRYYSFVMWVDTIPVKGMGIERECRKGFYLSFSFVSELPIAISPGCSKQIDLYALADAHIAHRII